MDNGIMAEWDAWARAYGRCAANRRNLGRSHLREIGEELGMSKQAVKYRVEALERDARRMGYIAARSAAFRELLFREILRHAAEPWFETYSGAQVDTLDQLIDQVAREVRSAYDLARAG